MSLYESKRDCALRHDLPKAWRHLTMRLVKTAIFIDANEGRPWEEIEASVASP
jgi:hypothetical protein